jgi:hypothetical protein
MRNSRDKAQKAQRKIKRKVARQKDGLRQQAVNGAERVFETFAVQDLSKTLLSYFCAFCAFLRLSS